MHFFKSLYQTIYSPEFYQDAIDLGKKKAMLVFFLFTLIITLIYSAVFAFKLLNGNYSLPPEIENFPAVSIENGVLSVDAEMPIEYESGQTYFMIDTTDTVTSLPPGYTQGVLLNSRTVTVRDTSTMMEDRIMSYDEVLNNLELEEFSIDKEDVLNFISGFSVVAIVAYPFVAFLWFFFWRLFVIFSIALVVWGIYAMMKISPSFSKAFIVTIYAYIPVFYITFITNKIGVLLGGITGLSLSSICCLLPLFFDIFIWGIFIWIGTIGARTVVFE